MQRLTWPAVGVLGILAAVVVALAVLSDWDPAAILAVVGILGGIGGGAAVAGGMSSRMDQVHAETVAQTPVLQAVARRVNGELDDRIAGAMEEAAETGAARALAVLRDQGVIR